MKVCFLKWLLIMSLTVAGLIMLFVSGWALKIWNADQTKLTSVILALFVFSSIRTGYFSFHQSASSENLESCENMCGYYPALGIIGTIIGFIVSVSVLGEVDPNSSQAVGQAMSDLSSGLGMALYTTLIGSVCSLIQSVQNANLKKHGF